LRLPNLDGLFFAMPALGFGYGQVFALSANDSDRGVWHAQSFGASVGSVRHCAGAFGALISNSLAGALNDKYEAVAHITVASLGSGIHVDHCIGMECYQYSFLVCVVSLAVATATNAWLFWRRRRRQRASSTAATGSTYMPLEETREQEAEDE
jgi:hypothetical protein